MGLVRGGTQRGCSPTCSETVRKVRFRCNADCPGTRMHRAEAPDVQKGRGAALPGRRCNHQEWGPWCYMSEERGGVARSAIARRARNRESALSLHVFGARGADKPAPAPAPLAQLKNSFALSIQPLSVGLCFSPPFLSDSSSSFSTLRWCSVSFTGVSTRTWQYRSPG